jgi:hypothetical protein
MLSALIPSIHSYPAVQLVPKPANQRYVQSSPLVLRPTPLKHKTPVTDRDRPVSRMFRYRISDIGYQISDNSVITNGLDYTTYQISDIRRQISDIRFLTSESRHPTSDFRNPAYRRVMELRFHLILANQVSTGFTETEIEGESN